MPDGHLHAGRRLVGLEHGPHGLDDLDVGNRFRSMLHGDENRRDAIHLGHHAGVLKLVAHGGDVAELDGAAAGAGKQHDLFEFSCRSTPLAHARHHAADVGR